MSTRSKIEGAIGGYFGLENPEGDVEPYSRLNEASILHSGRSVLRRVLEETPQGKIYVPYFFCDYVQDSLESYSSSVIYYHIDKNLLPVWDKAPDANDTVLFVNY